MTARAALRALVTVLACVLIVAPWALMSARTVSSFGPHTAEYSLTADGLITVDAGPLGSLLIPADGIVPLGLGVRADIGEIPSDSGAAGTVDALGQDVAAYAALFADPQAHGAAVARGLVDDALTRLTVGTAVLTALVGGVFVLLGPTRRKELVATRRRRTAAVVAAGGAAAVLIAVALPLQPRPEVQPNAVFDGTPLAGSQVTGRLSGVVDETAGAIAKMAEDNDAFYTAAAGSLAEEWGSRPMSHRYSSRGWTAPDPTGPLGGAVEPGSDVITAVFASDLHCQTGMSRIVGDVARWADADLYIDGGDITMTGTDAENICVDSLARALPQDLPVVFVKGNHDSAQTAEHAAGFGWTVLDGDPVDVAGLTFLGEPDPRRTVFGAGEELERGETQAEFAARVAEEACAAEPDVLLVHDPKHALGALGSGCADYSLHGHWHTRIGPEAVGLGVRYVNSTTGGALADALTPGPLKMDAQLSVIRIDAETGDPIDVMPITIGMDASVSFGTWEPFPAPAPIPATIGRQAENSEVEPGE